MTYDNELTLIEKIYSSDEIGNQVHKEKMTVILCSERSISRNEFYNAAVSDLKPEKVFVIHRYEYNNEREVIFDNKRYTIIRTYSEDTEEIELVCQRSASNV